MRLIAAVNFVVSKIEIRKELDTHTEKIQENETKINRVYENLEKVFFYGLDREVHDRKWALLVDGVPGIKNESTYETRKKTESLAKDAFKFKKPLYLQACHRLKPENNARIIIVFTDLDDRNFWLDNASKLKDYNMKNKTKINLCPDLPPAVRPLRNDIMMQRKELLQSSPEKVLRVMYSPRFPYVSLAIKGESVKFMPKFSKAEIMEKAMEIIK